jgi:hypothetical protein
MTAAVWSTCFASVGGRQAKHLEMLLHVSGEHSGAVRLGAATGVPEEILHGPIGGRLPIRLAPPFERRDPCVPQTLPELGEEPRLAHPGLAHDPHDLPLALYDPRQQRPQGGQLQRPPDKATARPRPVGSQGGGTGAEPEHLVRGARIGLAQAGDGRAGLQAHLVMHQPGGGGADQDGPQCRLLGEPGGALDRVPHGSVGQAPLLAQTAEQDPPCMQPHTYGARLPGGHAGSTGHLRRRCWSPNAARTARRA